MPSLGEIIVGRMPGVDVGMIVGGSGVRVSVGDDKTVKVSVEIGKAVKVAVAAGTEVEGC